MQILNQYFLLFKPSSYKIKKRVTLVVTLFLIVYKISSMKPFSYSIKALYSKLISIMKQPTQEYYNMRIILGLDSV